MISESLQRKSQLRHRACKEQIDGLIQLTRWKEHIPFVVPLTVLGALLATHLQGIPLDWRLAAVTTANILAVAYAFMFNDIEDAPDDSADLERAVRNAISSGAVSVRAGTNACHVVAGGALLLYPVGGLAVLGVGIAILLLTHLYSWRPVRLKAWPVIDILAHSLMLGGLLLLAGYFVYHDNPGAVWFVVAGVTLFSTYGQLYNQIRDFDLDQNAGLRNTAILLGKVNARCMMYLSLGLAVLCFLVAVFTAVFPLELGGALLGSILISTFFTSETDARGSAPADASGAMQIQALIVANLTVAAWLIYAIGGQMQVFAALGL